MAPTPGRRPDGARPDASPLDQLTVAAVALDVEGTVVYANAAADRLFEAPGRPLLGEDARLRLLGDGGQGGAFDEVLALVLTAGSWSGEMTMAGSGGRPTAMPTSWTAFEQDGRPAGALLLVEESASSALPVNTTAAAQQQARGMHRLAAVVGELLLAESVDAVAKVVTEHLTDAAGATLGSISLLVDDETLALVGIRGGREGVASRWSTYPLSSNTPAAETVRQRAPLVIVGRAELDRRYPGLETAAEGERSMVCLPLIAGERVLGVVTLSFPSLWQGDDAETVFLRLLADTCALTLDRLEAQRAAADRESMLAFLSESSARLASDLDYESTLTAVAEAAIPWFADWCTIALAEDGVLRTIAVAHAQPQLDEVVRELVDRYPPEPGDGSYRVLETGESILVPEVTDELLVEGARDDEHLVLTRRLELRSGLSCALKVHDRTFGVITWVTGEHGRRFTLDDQAFGENLAQRAAVAIDNAQLHSEVRDAALSLQQAVLPDRLPDVEGWTTAVHYQPSGRTDAGGDFYDVVPLADGRVGMFVGDVMGRGVQAASVMAQMRSAIRTLIAVDPAPSAVMSGMDRVFETLHLEHLVTMVYALADPGLDHLALINAGHPPPLLLRDPDWIEVLEPASTMLLGAGGGQRAVRSVDLAPGDALLMFTDGLVERRGEDADAGMARLIGAVRPPVPADAQAWLSALVEGIRDPTRDDDVAALLVRRGTAG